MEPGNETKEIPLLFENLNCYIISGNMSPTIQSWQKDFGELINLIGIKEENVHLEHLTNLNKPKTFFGEYKDWRKNVDLPNLPEKSKNTVVIAHSSGAELAMIWAEHHKNAGLILFSPYENSNVRPKGNSILEEYSGMFNKTDINSGEIIKREFDWDKIRNNSSFVIVVHSRNDKLVPLIQSLNVYRKIKADTTSKDIIFISSKMGGHYPVKGQLEEVIQIGKIFDKFSRENHN